MMIYIKFVIIYALVISLSTISYCHNKYSEEANIKTKRNDDVDFRPVTLKHLDKPFRMAKLNLLWSKAVVVCIPLFLNYFN